MGYVRLCLALIFAAGLAAFPGESLAAARGAMSGWALNVAPAIFPFIAVAPFLAAPEACAIYERILGSAVRRLFRLPAAAASAIVTGLFAGSPAGAMAVRETALRERMSPGSAARLAGIACGVSPGYALASMGVALAGSREAGIRYVISQLAAQLLTGMAFRSGFSGPGLPVSTVEPAEAPRPVAGAALAVLKVGGYMTLFAVGGEIVARLLGENARWLMLAADLPTGAALCARAGLPHWISAAALGFSGLCVIFQNIEILRPLGVRPGWLIFQKIVSSAACCGVFLLLEGLDIPANAVINVGSGDDFEVSMAFFALIMLPPALFFAGKTFFLTKRDPGVSTPKTAQNHNP